MSSPLDPIDAALLNRIQDDFPLCRRPFQSLGEALGLDETEIMSRLAALRTSGVLRQISAIFDTTALGYKSSLVAMRFVPDQLNAGAGLISAHPGVSHNYKRNHEFNLWFTVAVPPEASLDWTVARLSHLSG